MKKHFLSLITICLIALTFTSCELLALIGLANEVEKYNDEVTNYSVTIEWADGKPDGSGNWLELVQWRSNGEVFTKMSDVGDGDFRKFILEYDTELKDGAELFR